MSQEVPFRSVKITLSEEALDRLASLRFIGSFRSDSATIEECIRAVHDIAEDLCLELDRQAKARLGSKSFKETEVIPLDMQAEQLRRIGFRLARFVPKTRAMEELAKKQGLSAGT
jgi:hypothetical protein